MSTSTYSDAALDESEHLAGRRGYDLHTQNLDDPTFFRGYRVAAMNAAQIATLHRVVVEETNREYNNRLLSSTISRVLVGVYLIFNATALAFAALGYFKH